jgi:UDP-2,3-diacylglucosamine hydrolase
MCLDNIEIKEGAFILSDAHYSNLRPQFLQFLKDIDSKKLKPTQLIFLGDMFDTLFYQIPKTIQRNKEAIRLIDNLSKKMQIIYLEGNHDFNISKIFPNILVVPISKQPFACKINSKKVLLSHGDFNGTKMYKIYTSIIRNKLFLNLLGFIDKLGKNFILKKLDNYLAKKDDCKEFRGFNSFIKNRLEKKFNCDYFIEGHFHQDKKIELKNCNYINIGAFACNQRYFVVKSSTEEQLFEAKSFTKV